MSKILVIDTSQAKTGVGIFESGRVQAVFSDSSRQSAQEVLPLIQRLLDACGLQLTALDAIAVVTGPGSFTGLRIGIGVAQGLGASLERPLLGLSSLALLAFSAGMEHGLANWLVAQQARENELYFAAYRFDSTRGCVLAGREQVASYVELDSLSSQFIESSVAGEMWALAGSAWQHHEPEETFVSHLQAHSMEDACVMANLKFGLGETVGELLLPNYIKEELDYS